MSYLKLFKVTQDFGLGKQTVNQAFDNNQAQFDLYDTKHATGVSGLNTGGFSNPFRALGRHDDPLIARTTARIIVDSSTFFPTARAVVNGPMLPLLSPLYLGQGQWRFNVYTPQLFAAVAQAEADSALDRKAMCFVSYPPNAGPTLAVATWEISGGAWAPADFDFSITMWANAT